MTTGFCLVLLWFPLTTILIVEMSQLIVQKFMRNFISYRYSVSFAVENWNEKSWKLTTNFETISSFILFILKQKDIIPRYFSSYCFSFLNFVFYSTIWVQISNYWLEIKLSFKQIYIIFFILFFLLFKQANKWNKVQVKICLKCSNKV